MFLVGSTGALLASGDVVGALSAALSTVAADLSCQLPALSAGPRPLTSSPGAVAGAPLAIATTAAIVLLFGPPLISGDGPAKRPPAEGSS